jgi:prophage regulatory protein
MLATTKPVLRILRLPQIVDKTGLSQSTILREVDEGRFPRPIKIGRRAVGWVEDEISAWCQSRISARDADIKVAKARWDPNRESSAAIGSGEARRDR